MRHIAEYRYASRIYDDAGEFRLGVVNPELSDIENPELPESNESPTWKSTKLTSRIIRTNYAGEPATHPKSSH
jgi:hypothetical protein